MDLELPPKEFINPQTRCCNSFAEYSGYSPKKSRRNLMVGIVWA